MFFLPHTLRTSRFFVNIWVVRELEEQKPPLYSWRANKMSSKPSGLGKRRAGDKKASGEQRHLCPITISAPGTMRRSALLSRALERRPSAQHASFVGAEEAKHSPLLNVTDTEQWYFILRSSDKRTDRASVPPDTKL